MRKKKESEDVLVEQKHILNKEDVFEKLFTGRLKRHNNNCFSLKTGFVSLPHYS